MYTHFEWSVLTFIYIALAYINKPFDTHNLFAWSCFHLLINNHNMMLQQCKTIINHKHPQIILGLYSSYLKYSYPIINHIIYFNSFYHTIICSYYLLLITVVWWHTYCDVWIMMILTDAQAIIYPSLWYFIIVTTVIMIAITM